MARREQRSQPSRSRGTAHSLDCHQAAGQGDGPRTHANRESAMAGAEPARTRGGLARALRPRRSGPSCELLLVHVRVCACEDLPNSRPAGAPNRVGGAEGCLTCDGFCRLLMPVSSFILLSIGGATNGGARGGGNAFFLASSLASIKAHPRIFIPFLSRY